MKIKKKIHGTLTTFSALKVGSVFEINDGSGGLLLKVKPLTDSKNPYNIYNIICLETMTIMRIASEEIQVVFRESTLEVE
jgi:hypothetical protein